MNCRPVKVLIIEDNEDDFLIVRDMLTTIDLQQFQLEWAPGYEEGLQALQLHHYDAVLVDYRLAARNGIEFLREAESQGCLTPMILLTGQGNREIDREAIRAGAADFLDKNELSCPLLERTIFHALEREQAAEALRRSEERYRAFVANSSEAIWCFELEQPIPITLTEDEQIEMLYRHAYLSEYNDAMSQLYGFASPQEIVDVRLGDLLVRSNAANIEHLRSFIRSGYRLSDSESCESDSHGQTKYFLNNLVAIIKNGALQRVWGTQRDITEQREAEVVRSQLAAIVESSHDAIIGKALDGTILSWNQSAAQMYGYSAAEVIGRHISLLIPPGQEGEWLQLIDTIKQGGNVQQHETVRVRKDGTLIDVSLTVSPVKDAAGRLTGASTIARDITERKHAEEQLHFQKALLEAQTETALDGILVVSEKGKILSHNQRFVQLWNIPQRIIDEGNDSQAIQAVLDKVAHPRQFSEKIGYLYEHSREKSYEEILLADGRVFERYSAPVSSGDSTSYGRVWYFRDITERIRAEKALRASEERFRIVAETTSDLIYEWDILTDDLKWLGDIDAALGYAPGEFPRTLAAWEKAIHSEDRSRVMSAVERHLETGEPYREEYRIRHKSGTFLHWADSGTALRDAHGQPVKWIGACSDITEQKRAEAALRESEAELRTLVESIPQIVWMARPDGWHTHFNQKWMEFTGLTLQESLGHGWNPPVHPDDRPRAAKLWQEATESGETYEIEYRLRRADGVYHWMLGRALPLRDETGAIVKWFGTCTDIQEQKQAEEELNHFFTLSIEMLCIVGTDGYFKRLNPAWEQTLGYSNEELLSRPYLDFVHPEDRAATIAEAQKLAQGEDVVSFENRYRCADGSYRWVLWNSASMPGQRIIYAVAHDMTERKQAEANLKTYAAQLERSNRELQDFAYVASHDLQEPLRKIQAFSERLQIECSESLGEAGRDYLLRMQNAAGRMQGLIRELLAFSRVTSQAQPFVTVELEHIAQEVISDLETRIEQTGARVEVSHLPPIEADPLQMRQVLQNLISNALKFQPADSAPVVKVRGEITQVQENFLGEDPAIGALCHIMIEDNGIGFEEKHLERIFTPFQRLHGRNQYEGTGMGLAICRKIAERHGGYITAKSEPGHGATFIITLPVKQPQGGRA